MPRYEYDALSNIFLIGYKIFYFLHINIRRNCINRQAKTICKQGPCTNQYHDHNNKANYRINPIPPRITIKIPPATTPAETNASLIMCR